MQHHLFQILTHALYFLFWHKFHCTYLKCACTRRECFCTKIYYLHICINRQDIINSFYMCANVRCFQLSGNIFIHAHSSNKCYMEIVEPVFLHRTNTKKKIYLENTNSVDLNICSMRHAAVRAAPVYSMLCIYGMWERRHTTTRQTDSLARSDSTDAAVDGFFVSERCIWAVRLRCVFVYKFVWILWYADVWRMDEREWM